MTALRKITVQVPEDDLEMAQAYTGEGVTDTVRAALRKLANMRAQQELLKLRGKVRFSQSADELKYDDE
jgi:Arc/MetJ-type ribon-helix-helix transcriptional regulator